jgi:hypothetical protein
VSPTRGRETKSVTSFSGSRRALGLCFAKAQEPVAAEQPSQSASSPPPTARHAPHGRSQRSPCSIRSGSGQMRRSPVCRNLQDSSPWVCLHGFTKLLHSWTGWPGSSSVQPHPRATVCDGGSIESAGSRWAGPCALGLGSYDHHSIPPIESPDSIPIGSGINGL